MSGFIGGIAQAGGAAGVAAKVLGLGASTITLGSFVFRDFDLPEAVRWSVHQRMHRHLLPGGDIVVDTLGPVYPPIAWRGTFFGPLSVKRARAVAALARAGQLQTLTWMDQTYVVVIRDFASEDINDMLVRYSIVCEVAVDPSRVFALRPKSLRETVVGGISDALGFDVEDALDQATTILENLELAAAALGAFAPGSTANVNVAALAAQADAALAGSVARSETAVADLATLRANAAGAEQWINSAKTQTGRIARQRAALGHVGAVRQALAESGRG